MLQHTFHARYPIRIRGRDYEPGEMIDDPDIDPRVLARLQDNRRIGVETKQVSVRKEMMDDAKREKAGNPDGILRRDWRAAHARRARREPMSFKQFVMLHAEKHGVPEATVMDMMRALASKGVNAHDLDR